MCDPPGETDTGGAITPLEGERTTGTSSTVSRDIGTMRPSSVPIGLIRDAVADAASIKPTFVSTAVASSIARGAPRTKELRLERLCRAVMTLDRNVTPSMVLSSDFGWLLGTNTDENNTIETAAALDRAIATRWDGISTRNAMRDAVRSIVRAAANDGTITYDRSKRLLHKLAPETPHVDEDKQARGHIPKERVTAVFAELAADPSIHARRDAAIIAVMIGAGLRRNEVINLTTHHLDPDGETLLVTGKGNKTRTVPLPNGVRRAIQSWLKHRGSEPGPLFCPLALARPHTPERRHLSTGSLRAIIHRRLDKTTATHDLRRTAIGTWLDSGTDLSTAQKLAGHSNPSTTSSYDRRSLSTQRAAMDNVTIDFREPET